MQNFVGTLAVDSVGVGLAAFGFLDPLLAAFIHVTSELAFILNSRDCCREVRKPGDEIQELRPSLSGGYTLRSFDPKSETARVHSPHRSGKRRISDRRIRFVVRYITFTTGAA
jgi:hypothetical protein